MPGTLRGHPGPVAEISFADVRTPTETDARFYILSLARLDRGSGAILWDTSAAEGEAFLARIELTPQTLAVAFTPDWAIAVSGESSGAVHVWNVAADKLITTLEGHTDQVRAVAISPCGTRAASVSLDGTVRLWALPR